MVGNGLLRAISRHEHQHSKDHKRHTPQTPHDNSFSFTETQSPGTNGKSGRLYEVQNLRNIKFDKKTPKKISKSENFLFPKLTQENIHEYKTGEEEPCPYIRNPIVNRHNSKIYGTCALTGDYCPGHYAYNVGQPSCLVYADFWKPANANRITIPLRFEPEKPFQDDIE